MKDARATVDRILTNIDEIKKLIEKLLYKE